MDLTNSPGLVTCCLVTDDSYAAQRGGDPPREDADATAQVVQSEVAARLAKSKLPQREGPAQSYQPSDPQGYQADSPASPEPAAHPTASPELAAHPTASPEPATQTTPIHSGDEQQSEAYPISGAWSVGPPRRDWPPQTGPISAADPAYRPEAIPTAATDPAYEPESTPTSGTGPVYRPGIDPIEALPPWSATDPISGGGAPPDPYGFVVTPSYTGGPRIEPTPKQPKGRYLLPALVGLLAGLLVFGTGGWFLGRATAADPDSAADPKPTASAPAPAPTGAYEQNQIAINRPKLTGTLGTISLGWLPRLSACSRSGDKGGPALNDGEKVRVRCQLDAMSIIFVEYDSAGERDKARAETVGLNADDRRLAPGVGAAVVRASPSGRTDGNYVEFAYQADGKTVSGLWWDDTATPVAAYLLAFWKDGVREKWEPMRDVWARYA